MGLHKMVQFFKINESTRIFEKIISCLKHQAPKKKVLSYYLSIIGVVTSSQIQIKYQNISLMNGFKYISKISFTNWFKYILQNEYLK